MPFVDREAELSELEKWLKAKEPALLLTGELGIGRSALVQEFAKIARNYGHEVYIGRCMPDRSFGLFRSAGLDRWLTMTPRVDGVYAMHRDGRLLAKAERAACTDPEIFTSMLNAVESFIRDSWGMPGEASHSSLSYGDRQILLERGRGPHLAAVLSGGGDVQPLREEMRGLVATVDAEYCGVLEKWDGDIRPFEPLAGKLQTLLDHYGEESQQAISRPEQLYERFLERFLRAERPFLFAADDLHAADQDSLALLCYLLRGLPEGRGAFLLTYRSADLAGRADDLVAELRERGTCEMRLGPLGMKAVRQRLEADARPAESLVEAMVRQTGGNPSYLERAIGVLKETALLDPKSPLTYAEPDITKIEATLSASAEELVRTQLARLGGTEIKVMKRACMIGTAFGAAELEALGLDPWELEDVLGGLLAKGMLQPVGDSYLLPSAVRQGAYGSIEPASRPRLHAATARALEELWGGQPQRWPDLAKQWQAAGEQAKAVEWLEKAAEAAERELGYETALTYWGAAVELAEGKTRLGLLSRGIAAARLAGERGHQRDFAVVRHKLAAELGEVAAEAEALLVLGEVAYEHADYRAAEQHLKVAIGKVGPADASLLAEANRLLAGVAWRRGELDAAEGYTDRAIGLRGSPSDLRMAGNIAAARGRLDVAIEHFKSVIEGGDPEERAYALNNVGQCLLYKGDRPRARSHFEAAVELAKAHRLAKATAHALSNLAGLYDCEPDNEDAAGRELLGYAKRLGDPRLEVSAYTILGTSEADKGSRAGADYWYGKALELAAHLDSALAEGVREDYGKQTAKLGA